MGSGMVRPGDGEWALCGLCWSQFSVPDLLETRVAFLFEVRTSGWGQSELLTFLLAGPSTLTTCMEGLDPVLMNALSILC